ncbi:MAG: hypothetical protein ACRDMH_03715 [Solirubrobacterales bacterium]
MDDSKPREIRRRLRRFGIKPTPGEIDGTTFREPRDVSAIVAAEFRERRQVGGPHRQELVQYVRGPNGQPIRATDPGGGRHLYELRTARGWSLDDLSRRTMTPWRSLWLAETQGERLGADQRRSVAHELHCGESELP